MKLKVLVGVLGLCMASAAMAGKSGTGEGTVNKVKVDAEKLNITHGPISGLMDGMTMDFAVMDPAMLQDVQAGDKIKFAVEESNGNYVITDIQVTGKGKVAADDGHSHSH